MSQPSTANPFTSPGTPGSSAPAPRPRDLQGCIVAYAPIEFTPAGAPGNTQGLGGQPPRDRVTADLYLLATPGNVPISFGGSPEYEADPRAHTLNVMAPAKFTGVWVGNSNIVRYALAPGGVIARGTMVLGRVERSDIGNRPFNLVKLDGTPEMDRAILVWSQIQMGQLQFFVPTQIPGAPAYAGPAQRPQGQPYMTAPATLAPYASQQTVAAPVLSPPPGWTEQGWATLTTDQRAQVWAAVAPQPAPQAPASIPNPW